MFKNIFQKIIPNNSPDRFKLIYLVLAFLCLVVVLALSVLVIRGLSDRYLAYDIRDNAAKITDALIYTEVEAISIEEKQGVTELGVRPAQFDALDTRIRDIFDQLQILKIVIYNKKNRVVYSTEKHIINTVEDKNELLAKALSGTQQLNIHKMQNVVDMMGEKRLNTTVAEVYVPVLHKDNSVIGAVAVYSDISGQKQEYWEQLWSSIIILTGAILLVSLMSYFVIVRASRELKQAYNLLEVYAKTDALTGVFNRGELMRRAEEPFVMMQRSRDKSEGGVGIGIIMIDLDNFKLVNDVYGHQVGDCVLCSTAERIGSVMRTYDVLGRYGGEEFLVVLPNTTPEEVHAIALRTLESIRSTPIQVGDLSMSVTASFGATWAATEKENLDSVIRRADELLYEAKKTGRNKVVFRV